VGAGDPAVGVAISQAVARWGERIYLHVVHLCGKAILGYVGCMGFSQHDQKCASVPIVKTKIMIIQHNIYHIRFIVYLLTLLLRIYIFSCIIIHNKTIKLFGNNDRSDICDLNSFNSISDG
jgi:hypothetical protein